MKLSLAWDTSKPIRGQKWDREQDARMRKFRGEPDPFPEDFKERFLQSILLDPEFGVAIVTALGLTGGA